jgi:hypothetical protein
MKIECINGYYKFYPATAAQIALMESIYGVELVKMNGFHTFEHLSKVGDYSIAGATIDGITYNKTYAGKPEDVLLENKLTFDLAKYAVVSFLTIISTETLASDQLKFASKYLLQAYSVINKQKIKSFTAFYDFNEMFYSYDKLEVL